MALGYSEVAQDQGVAPNDQVAMILALLEALHISSVDLVANDSGARSHTGRALSRPSPRILLTNCDTEIDSPPLRYFPLSSWLKAERGSISGSSRGSKTSL